jgi:hypothetical protein
MSNKDDKMMILLVAAGIYYMSKRPAYAAGYQQNGANTGPMKSLPASIGTGAGQALGGALGGLLKGWLGGSSTTYAPNTSMPNAQNIAPTPDWNAAYQDNPELMDNVMQYGV